MLFVLLTQCCQKSDLHYLGWINVLPVSESLDATLSTTVSDGWCKSVGLSQLQLTP
jgi:hypothetical protein